MGSGSKYRKKKRVFFEGLLNELHGLTISRMGVILPSDVLDIVESVPMDWEVHKKIRFRNGGLPVYFVIWKRA